MEVMQVLHMNGGLGEASYANNSLIQRKVISMTKPIIDEAITELYISMNGPKNLRMADLGCSSGPNTLIVAKEVVKIVEILCRKLGHQLPEFQIHLNDLNGNDFNSVFQSLLPKFPVELREEMGLKSDELISTPPCFVSAVPGSFYGRLFASKTLDFVHSSYSLMWLSKVPEMVELMNKERIYMSSTSPRSVTHAYYRQFEQDFSMFLKCRSEEVVGGGRMVFTILGRKSEDANSKECCYIWEILAQALNQMVSEGFIEEEKLHSFNIPQYTPSPSEVETQIKNEGSFAINRLETSEISWAACADDVFYSLAGVDHGYNVAKCMRSVAEPLLIQQFGESVIDPLFDKYSKLLSDRMTKDEDTKFINVTVSITRL